MLTEQDIDDLHRAKAEYRNSVGRAIHMSTDHVRNLLRIVEKLLLAPK